MEYLKSKVILLKRLASFNFGVLLCQNEPDPGSRRLDCDWSLNNRGNRKSGIRSHGGIHQPIDMAGIWFKAKIKAVIFTQSHVDHFGGAGALLKKLSPLRQAQLQIFSTNELIEEASSKNVISRRAMDWRKIYIYGKVWSLMIKNMFIQSLAEEQRQEQLNS